MSPCDSKYTDSGGKQGHFGTRGIVFTITTCPPCTYRSLRDNEALYQQGISLQKHRQLRMPIESTENETVVQWGYMRKNS